MKTITLLLVLALCLVSISCKNHAAEVTAFANEKSEVVTQMSQKIEANPTEAGIDEARKIFDARKTDLKAKWVVIQKANLDLNAKRPIMDAESFDNKLWLNVYDKNAVKLFPIKEKFYALKTDFDATFK